MKRIITARDQVHMLAPWHAVDHHEMLSPRQREAFRKEARYPQVWRGEAPYGHLPDSGRARNQPPSVHRDPDNPEAGIIDPSEIRYEDRGGSISAYHPNGDHLGNYSWEGGDYGEPAHIAVAQVNPRYQGQGVGGGIIDHIREHHEPDLAHSGYQGNGSLSYQGRAAALRDLGNTEEEHNDYFNTTPYNYGSTEPATFGFGHVTEAQRQAHAELMQQFEEDKNHPNYTGRRSENPHDPDLYDEDGDRHEYGYDSDGDYVGLSSGGKDSEGYSDEGYNYEGYDRDGFDRGGLDEDGYDQEGFHDVTGLNRDGETRHGYTPGDGTPPEGTVPMSQMASHWKQNGLPTSPEHQEMMNDADGGVMAPTMYAVRNRYERGRDGGGYHVGNGDTLYSSLDRARQMAYHPDDPRKDKDIVSVDHLDPDYLHTDASGQTPEDFHYAPESNWNDGEDTASTPASIVHDPQRHQRILGDLGYGWKQSTLDYSPHPSFEYADPNGGRTGRMYQQDNGAWQTEHQPEFGSMRRRYYDNYADAADAIREGTAPGPTMDQHALEVNNDYQGSGQGEVDWEPHPTGQGLTARTPHGDLHVVQDSNTGAWNWHAGPHGSQPGDEGNMSSPLSDNLTRAAASGIRAITRNPFHGGLGDQLGEGWVRHPAASGGYTRRLPSGNHGYIVPHDDGGYTAGIQHDNGRGQPYAAPIVRRSSPDLAEAQAFIQHRDSPIPASALGQGWSDYELGPRSFPAYTHEGHPSGSRANIAWGEQGGWQPTVHHQGEMYQGSSHKTPQQAASWASSLMDDLGNGKATNQFS